MNRTIYISALLAVLLAFVPGVKAERLVILHTNDTHSTVLPERDSNLGGALRRKAVVDSVRAAVPNMLLIDAGDAVQGSLFFTLFGGEVERKLMNAQRYDIAIVGNHEFDNGLQSLYNNYKDMDAELLASNYDYTGTPLEGMFLPYSIRTYGDKRIAFIAININPDGLIDAGNIKGVKYSDAITTANQLAHLLKSKEKADMVIAITHIGYVNDGEEEGAGDVMLAEASKDIDVIIGGHSHTLLAPGSEQTLVPNANGKPVLVVQTGKNGRYMGEIDIDLETLAPTYSLITIDSRLDDRADPEIAAMIDIYKAKVDSVSAIKIGATKAAMAAGSDALLNLASDVVFAKGAELLGRPVDLSIMNKGGLRAPLPKGTVTKGDIMTIFPFDNRLTIVELTGAELRQLLDGIAARGGQGISANADVKMDKATGKATEITINGQPLDDNATYTIATIDYLAKGNDYMSTFKGKPWLAKSDRPIYNEIIDYIVDLGGKKLTSDNRTRMHY